MVTEFLEFCAGGIFTLINALLSLLPQFDVTQYISLESGLLSQSLGWLNWFVPVGNLIAITGAWLSCIVIYQAYLLFSGFLFKLLK